MVHESAVAALLQDLTHGGVGSGTQRQQHRRDAAAGAQATAPAAAAAGGVSGTNTTNSSSGSIGPQAAAQHHQHHYVAVQQPHDPLSLSLSLRVRRGHVLMDALSQIRGCAPQVCVSLHSVLFEQGRFWQQRKFSGLLNSCASLLTQNITLFLSPLHHTPSHFATLMCHTGAEEAPSCDLPERGWVSGRGGR